MHANHPLTAPGRADTQGVCISAFTLMVEMDIRVSIYPAGSPSQPPPPPPRAHEDRGKRATQFSVSS